jgi:hypothetical protein
MVSLFSFDEESSGIRGYGKLQTRQGGEGKEGRERDRGGGRRG